MKTVPLGPREVRKVTVKTLRRNKAARTSEEAESTETTGESTTTSKDTSDVVTESAKKVSRHLEAEVSGGYLNFDPSQGLRRARRRTQLGEQRNQQSPQRDHAKNGDAAQA